MWQVRTTDEFDAWFRSLGDTPEGRAGRVELIAVVELLKEFGPRLSRPHADTLKGSAYANLKELRARTSDMVLRVVFAFDPEREAILLVGGDKSGVAERRFYKQLIASAESLYAAHLRGIKRKK